MTPLRLWGPMDPRDRHSISKALVATVVARQSRGSPHRTHLHSFFHRNSLAHCFIEGLHSHWFKLGLIGAWIPDPGCAHGFDFFWLVAEVAPLDPQSHAAM